MFSRTALGGKLAGCSASAGEGAVKPMSSHDESEYIDPPGQAGQLFGELAQLVYASEDFAEVYQAICAAAPNLIAGCDHASMLLRRGGQVVSVGASDETARRIDELELELGEGPCLDAIEDEPAHLDANLLDGCPWPALAARVVAETPVRGMAGFRLIVDHAKVGALNLFSDTPGAFTPASMEQAAVLTAFASVAVTSDANRQQAATLMGGLQSNREIGMAVGLLMAFHKINKQQAFDILRRASQDMNIKLIEVARQLVQHEDQRPRKTD